MSATQTSNGSTNGVQQKRTVAQKLEVVVLAVSDVDRARDFYDRLGWRLDGDAALSDDYRIIQLTPPGSPASIIFGKGITNAAPGAGADIVLAVDDVDAARAEIAARGVEISEVFHDAGGSVIAGFQADTAGHASGRDPEGRSYASYATFSDPDGNGWLLQELGERAPGRVEQRDVTDLAALLRETAEHHDAFEKASDPHDWWDWYAAYFAARSDGEAIAEAEAAADRYMADAFGVPRR